MDHERQTQEITTRLATEDDIPYLVELGGCLFGESGYDGWYSKEKVDNLLCNTWDSQDVFLLVAMSGDKHIGYFWGAVGEMLYCDLVSAYDISFYVLPEYRGWIAIRMLMQFKKWAISKKAKTITLGISTDIKTERTQKLYDRLGFKVVGTQHRMVLDG